MISDTDPSIDALLAAAPGLWFWSHDPRFLTLDERGGVAAWADRAGSGFRLVQHDAALRPLYAPGAGVNFFWATDGGRRQAWLAGDGLSLGPAHSGGMIVWPRGLLRAPLRGLGAAQPVFLGGARAAPALFGEDDGAPLPCRGAVVTWRSAPDGLSVRIDGVESRLPPRGRGGTLTRIALNRFDAGPSRVLRIDEVLVFGRDIGAEGLDVLDAALRARAPVTDRTRTVVIYGDSLSTGVGAESGRPWHDHVTHKADWTWFSLSVEGGGITAPHVCASSASALKGAREGVAIIWIGANDILTGASGARAAAKVEAYARTLRHAGMRVIVCTLQNLPENDGEALRFNAALADSRGAFDAIVDLRGAFPDCCDRELFTGDGVHMTDAGYRRAAGRIEAALTRIP